MLDKRVPRPPSTLNEMVEVCACVDHRQGTDGLPNGYEDEAQDSGEEGNAPLEAGEEVELEQGL